MTGAVLAFQSREQSDGQVSPQAGFVRKLESECVGELVAEARATVDPDFDDSPDSVTGQIAGIVASKHAELWEVLEAVYGSLSENASGASLTASPPSPARSARSARPTPPSAFAAGSACRPGRNDAARHSRSAQQARWDAGRARPLESLDDHRRAGRHQRASRPRARLDGS